MTFEPTSIAFRLDDVIVQKEPAWPLYCEHSFVAWRAPLRGELPAWLATAVMPAARMKTAISPAKRLKILYPLISSAPFLSLFRWDLLEQCRWLLELPVRLRECQSTVRTSSPTTAAISRLLRP